MSEITLLGKGFAVAPKLALMPLLRFAHLSTSGLDTDDEEAMAAMYDLLRAVIADEDWGAFQAHANATRADQNDLMGAVKAAIAVMTARPTVRPSDSSDGPPLDGTSSLEPSSSPESSTPAQDTPSAPLLRDERVRALVAIPDWVAESA